MGQQSSPKSKWKPSWKSPLSFNGHDERGNLVDVKIRQWTDPVHFTAGEEGWITLHASKASVVDIRGNLPVVYRFSLINLTLESPPYVTLRFDEIELIWEPLPTYHASVAALGTRERFAQTCTLTVTTGNLSAAREKAEIACELASYAQGCRVQWIRCEGIDATGAVACTSMSNSITSAYVPLSAFRNSDIWQFIQSQWRGYSDFRATTPKHARRLLGLMMNSIAMDDFIETRGMKLVSTVEALVAMVVPSLPQPRFKTKSGKKKFGRAVRDFIRSEAMTYLIPDAADTPGRSEQWAEHIASMNRDILMKTFRELIYETCSAIEIDVDPLEMQTLWIHEINLFMKHSTFAK